MALRRAKSFSAIASSTALIAAPALIVAPEKTKGSEDDV
jgi:hypothetical protein